MLFSKMHKDPFHAKTKRSGFIMMPLSFEMKKVDK